MRKLQCPKCLSTNILYCPIVEEFWTIQTIHENGALNLGDLEDSVTQAIKLWVPIAQKIPPVKEMKIFESEKTDLNLLFERQMKTVRNLIKSYTEN